jgi:hypothetical protein
VTSGIHETDSYHKWIHSLTKPMNSLRVHEESDERMRYLVNKGLFEKPTKYILLQLLL